MNIYISGAIGVLGRRLVKSLASRGHSVTGMARSAEGEKIVISLGGRPSRASLFDSQALLSDIQGSDVIIHAATSIPVKTRVKPEDYALNDLEGVWHVVDDSPVKVGEFMNEFAKRLVALPLRRLPAWLARFLAGKYTVDFFTASTVTSNKKLREGSSWTPQYSGYKEGLEQIIGEWKAEGFLV